MTLCDRLTLLPPTHKIYLHVCDWIISQALSYSPHPCQKAQSDNISPEHIYLFNECRTTLTLSLYWPRFLTLYLPRIEATTSPSLAKTELFTLRGYSNLGLICVGIYSGRFRLYFRSIRPTTTPNTVATHATPLVDFPLARSSLSRTSFLAFNVAPWYYWKNYVVLLIIINKLQNYTPIVHLEWNKFRPTN